MWFVLVLLFNPNVAQGDQADSPKWYATTFHKQKQKENRYLLNDTSDQILRIPDTDWRCISPPAQSEYKGQVWIRMIQCMVKGSELMVGGAATCLMSSKGQPGSLNIDLHQGMDQDSTKFEPGKKHRSVSLTLECKK